MAGNNGTSGKGRRGSDRLAWRRAIPWDRLRLREKASMLVFSVAVVLGMLVTLVVVLEYLDRGGLVTAENARAAQLSLNRFSLAMNNQRTALAGYLLTHDSRTLAQFRAAHGETRADEAELVALAAQDGVDVGPVRTAADAWQAWATTAVGLKPGAALAGQIDQGDRLFSALEGQERRLDRQLDGAATRAATQADQRSAFLATVTPAVGMLLLGLLLFLGGLVIRSMLRPINQLAETARAISRGEDPDIPAVGRDDELGQLARALEAWRQEATNRLEVANAVTAEKEQQARTLELLNHAATATTGVLESASLGHILVEQVGELLGGADAVLSWNAGIGPDESGALAWAGVGTGPDEVSIADGFAAEAFASGEPLLVEDYQSWPSANSNGLSSGIRSLAVVPLTVGDRRNGVLAAFTRGHRRLDRYDLQVLALLAAQAAPALNAARLHTELLRAHRDLTRTNEELQRASRHKSDFLASMSHELRTPLNAILGFSELLLDSDEHAIDQARRTSFLQHIHNSGKYLLNLINDMLDLSKVEAGRMELRETVFDLTESISSALSTMSPLADKGQVVVSSTSTAPLLIRADEEKVGQMLLNLLSNAIKFTPEGGRVTVDVRQEPDRLVICVADTGVGIAKENQDRIFEEFQQLATAGAPQRQGTGLGLTLTRRLAELHGGEVWVESEPGEGSRFFLGLPASRLETRPIIAQPAEGPLVLVIEDNPGTAALVVDTLRQEGYRTEVLPEGEHAVSEAARLQPFAILLAMSLHDARGKSILEALEAPPTRSLPVLVMMAPGRPGEGDGHWLADRAHAVMEKDDVLGVELIRHLQTLRARRAPAARR